MTVYLTVIIKASFMLLQALQQFFALWRSIICCSVLFGLWQMYESSIGMQLFMRGIVHRSPSIPRYITALYLLRQHLLHRKNLTARQPNLLYVTENV